ncbi:MAG: RagB/SusD family nutrient uptake outer membrane protein [Ginsengibacter sp.]
MKKLIIAGAALCFMLASCKKDFLNRYPQTSIAPQLFFKSEQDLSLYINGLLNHPGKGNYFSDQSSDNLATTASIEVKNIMTGTPSAQTITGGWNWGRLRNINYFLENYNTAAVDEATKSHYVGLARYYRAQFYFEMVKRYSDVPWYSKTIAPSDSAELYLSRSPRSQVMDSVMADLAFASANVRDKVPAGTPGLWAVKTYYGRVALYEGTYRKYHPELNLQSTANRFLDTASAVAKSVISANKFSIYNTGKPNQDYATLFNSQDLTTNPEVILTTIFDATKPNGGSNINSTVFGDYEQSPSRDLVQSYLMKDGTRFTAIPGYNNYTYVQEFQDRDPRLMQTLVYPGWVRAPATNPFVPFFNKNFSGYFQLKGYINSTDNIAIGSVDFPAYRYAEVLLTYAEAQAELGRITQSDIDMSVNLLRKRVGLQNLDLAMANTNSDPILMAKYPDLTSNNKGVLLEIRRERRVEFALEGYRYDDQMRWHAGKLLEKIPVGMYFPALGKYDLTGDGVEDVILISKDATIPAASDREKNSLGVPLIYYKAGNFGNAVTIYLSNGTGGTIVTEVTPRNFIDPKYYYRPIPYTQTVLNGNLKQIFGW